jgi:hypothetical protein
VKLALIPHVKKSIAGTGDYNFGSTPRPSRGRPGGGHDGRRYKTSAFTACSVRTEVSRQSVSQARQSRAVASFLHFCLSFCFVASFQAFWLHLPLNIVRPTPRLRTDNARPPPRRRRYNSPLDPPGLHPAPHPVSPSIPRFLPLWCPKTPFVAPSARLCALGKLPPWLQKKFRGLYTKLQVTVPTVGVVE